MRFRAAASIAITSACYLPLLIALSTLSFAGRSPADELSPNDNLLMTAARAATWTEGNTHVVQLDGPVSIDLDRTRMTAAAAVVWLTPIKGAVLDEQRAEIALVGEAVLTQPNQIRREGDTLFVTAAVRGVIRVTAAERLVADRSRSDVCLRARALRPIEVAPNTQINGDEWLVQPPLFSSPTTAPAAPPPPAPPQPIAFRNNGTIDTVRTADGTIALALTGDVALVQRRPDGELIELQSQRAVLFTPLHSLREVDKTGKTKRVEDYVTGAYLEGDVRIVLTPGKPKASPQRLYANRVFYDFTTDRAILTDAIVHTIDFKSRAPFIVRAQTIRQLSAGEYVAGRAHLTTSGFATPSYGIGVGQVYVRQIESQDPAIGTYSDFTARNATFRLYDVPVFYWPYLSGTLDNKGLLLRNAAVVSSSVYGTGIVTQWGLFETLGKVPPKDTDATYQLDYFSKRGPGGGIDGEYTGGWISETTREPWSFDGRLRSFLVNDIGDDQLSRNRNQVDPPSHIRGRIDWAHQQFLPDNWQVQLTFSYSSDPTFREEWFENEFYREPPHQTSAYVKHQVDNQALTFLASYQLNNFVTSSDAAQEQAEVQHLPELAYHLTGQSVGRDNFTFFSDDTLSGLSFHNSRASLAEQGYAPGQTPGLPSYGTTGTPGKEVYRGDFRQELDFPFTLGQFRFVPYVLGRYTAYSDSPESDVKNRLYAGAGVRVTTAFWKVNDAAQSDLFDIHRLRHVIEPELHLFTGATNVRRDRLLQYDQEIDQINDINAVQLAIRQRWQTMRGGAGQWRSVDVFSLNLEANFFARKPNDNLLNPLAFRGLFFDSLPESSIPRNSINADAMWRISDQTVVLSDAQYNVDHHKLATASIGIAAQRGGRIDYFLGTRYIAELNSNVTTFAADYVISTHYTVGFRQSFDFGDQHTVGTDLLAIRHFDRFYAGVTVRYDYNRKESGILFNVWPEGFGSNSADRMHNIFNR